MDSPDVHFTIGLNKYQYRVTRRPILMKSLTFWGNNLIIKAFKSWKMHSAIMKDERIKFRTFWCIKWSIAIIDNTSIYDRVIYPSQAISLRINDYDERVLSETIGIYEHEYLKRLFSGWKDQYIKIRNKKANIAYTYISDAFAAWIQFTQDKKKLNSKKNDLNTSNHE